MIASQPRLAIEGTVRALWSSARDATTEAVRSAMRTSGWAPTRRPSPKVRQRSHPASESNGSCVEGRRNGSRSSAPHCPTSDGSTPYAVRASLPGGVACHRRRRAHQGRHRRVRFERHGTPRAGRDRRISRCAAHLGRRHRGRRLHVGVHGRARHRRDPRWTRRSRDARVRLDGPRRPEGAAPAGPTSPSVVAVLCSSTRRSVTP